MEFYKVTDPGETYDTYEEKFLRIGGSASKWEERSKPGKGIYVALIRADGNFRLVTDGYKQWLIDKEGIELVKESEYELKIGDKVLAIGETAGWGQISKFAIGTISSIDKTQRHPFGCDFERHRDWRGQKCCFMPIKEEKKEEISSVPLAKSGMVRVNDTGHTYSTADTLAESLKATKWESGNKFPNGTICKIINSIKHPKESEVIVYLLEDKTGKQSIVGHKGFIQASSAEIEEFNKSPKEEVKKEKVKVKTFKHGDQIICIKTDYPHVPGTVKIYDKPSYAEGLFKITASNIDFFLDRWEIYVPKEDHTSWKDGDKLKCIKPDHPYKVGDIVTFKSWHISNKTFHSYEKGMYGVVDCFVKTSPYDHLGSIGDLVEVTNSNHVHDLADSFARDLEHKYWKKGNSFNNGKICKIINYSDTLYKDRRIYLVRDLEDTKDVLISNLGIKKYIEPLKKKSAIVKEKPVVEKVKKLKIQPWQPGEKLICTVKCCPAVSYGDIVTFKRPYGDVFYYEEGVGTLYKAHFKRASLVEEAKEEVKEEVQTKETKTIEKEKEIVMAKEKGIIDRIKEGASVVVSKQGDIAKTAAVLEGAKILNNQLVKAIRPKLPMFARGYADTALCKAVFANILMFGIETAFPDAPENDIRKQIAKAAVITSYQEVIQELDIEGMVNKLFESPALAKITKKFTDSEEEK